MTIPDTINKLFTLFDFIVFIVWISSRFTYRVQRAKHLRMKQIVRVRLKGWRTSMICECKGTKKSQYRQEKRENVIA